MVMINYKQIRTEKCVKNNRGILQNEYPSSQNII